MQLKTVLPAIFLGICGAVAYFWWHSPARQMVSIFVTGKNGECIISEGKVGQGPSLLCAEAPTYLRSTLELAADAKVTVAATRQVGPQELNALLGSLAGEGYEIEKVIKAVGFVKE